MTARAAVILAAGQGTRMKSDLPKVLHQVGGRPMLDWSIALAESVGCDRIVVVCSANGHAVHKHVEATLGAGAIAIQDPPMGTGHAVRCAEQALEGFEGHVAVLYGDTPFISQGDLETLLDCLEAGHAVGVLGFEAEQPGAYGRLIASPEGGLEAIVEARDATAEQIEINLCNSGVMVGAASDMFSMLSRVKRNELKQEYYLTDLVEIARTDDKTCALHVCPEQDVLGVNSRLELSRAESIFQAKKRDEMMLKGVTLTAPETVFFSHDTTIEPDVIIEPNVVFGLGVTVQSGANVRAFSHLEGATVASGAVIGPFARLRPGAKIGEDCRVGNFVEVKNTVMETGAKANHLSYLGDGEVGAGANIGAGTIFCNYDGFLKYRTKIGQGAFIGSNSALVAPVEIGDGAMVGSGSVITKNVEAGALAVARGTLVSKSGWATRFRDKMAAIKAAKKQG